MCVQRKLRSTCLSEQFYHSLPGSIGSLGSLAASCGQRRVWPMLNCVLVQYVVHTCHFVGFSVLWFKCFYNPNLLHTMSLSALRCSKWPHWTIKYQFYFIFFLWQRRYIQLSDINCATLQPPIDFTFCGGRAEIHKYYEECDWSKKWAEGLQKILTWKVFTDWT